MAFSCKYKLNELRLFSVFFFPQLLVKRRIQNKVRAHHLNKLLVKLGPKWKLHVFLPFKKRPMKFYDSHITRSESISTARSRRDEYWPYTAEAFTADNIFILALSTVRRAIMSYYASSAIKILGVQTLNTRMTSHALTTHWRSAQTSQLVYQTREWGKARGREGITLLICSVLTDIQHTKDNTKEGCLCVAPEMPKLSTALILKPERLKGHKRGWKKTNTRKNPKTQASHDFLSAAFGFWVTFSQQHPPPSTDRVPTDSGWNSRGSQAASGDRCLEKKASQSQGFVVGAGLGAEIIHQRAFMSDGAKPATMKFQQQAECTVP